MHKMFYKSKTQKRKTYDSENEPIGNNIIVYVLKQRPPK